MVAVVVLGLIAVALLLRHKRNLNNEFVVKQKSGTKNYLIWVYRFYQKVPILNKVFSKVKSAVEKFYPADSISINKKVSSILLKMTLLFMAGVLASIVIANGDIYFMLVGITITFVGVKGYTAYVLRSMDTKILNQFANFLAKLRHCYHEEAIIDVALNNSLDELPYEIRLHIQKIYDIIINPNMENEIEKYIGSEPNQYVLMFLSLCSQAKEFGDKKLEDGSSIFLNDLNYLKEEVNNEIIAQRRNYAAFLPLPFIVLFPILMIKPLELWATSNLEGIDNYYSSIAGIASMIGLFILSIGSYVLITALRDNAISEEVDKNIFTRIANIESFGISNLITKIVYKHYTKFRRYNDMARGMGDHTGMKAFLVKRVVYAIAAFVVTLFIFIAGTITSRYTIMNNWSTTFDDVMAPSDEYSEAMEQVGKDYVHIYHYDKTISEAEFKKNLVDDITTSTEITNDEYATQIADTVYSRLAKYDNTYFKFWELLIAFLISVFAFNIPVIYLKFKSQIIELRKEEEVVRFQSIMLILMHMDGTTVDVILEWMERFSYCFKESIIQCRLEAALGTQVALENMKDSESYEAFKDFCDNLISIDKVGVVKAFDEIQTDREYFMKKREQDREENLARKLAKAHRFMYLPLFGTIILYLLVPMGIYAFNTFSTMKDVL